MADPRRRRDRRRELLQRLRPRDRDLRAAELRDRDPPLLSGRPGADRRDQRRSHGGREAGQRPARQRRVAPPADGHRRLRRHRGGHRSARPREPRSGRSASSAPAPGSRGRALAGPRRDARLTRLAVHLRSGLRPRAGRGQSRCRRRSAPCCRARRLDRHPADALPLRCSRVVRGGGDHGCSGRGAARPPRCPAPRPLRLPGSPRRRPRAPAPARSPPSSSATWRRRS